MNPPRTPLQAFFRHILSLDWRILAIGVIIFLFLVTGTAATSRRPAANTALTPTLNPTPLPNADSPSETTEVTPTPLPRELVENENQTVGLTLASTVLVLIVVVAILRALLTAPREEP